MALIIAENAYVLLVFEQSLRISICAQPGGLAEVELGGVETRTIRHGIAKTKDLLIEVGLLLVINSIPAKKQHISNRFERPHAAVSSLGRISIELDIPIDFMLATVSDQHLSDPLCHTIPEVTIEGNLLVAALRDVLDRQQFVDVGTVGEEMLFDLVEDIQRAVGGGGLGIV